MNKNSLSQGLKRLGAQLLGGALLAGILVILSMSSVQAASSGPVTGTNCSAGCDLYATTGILTLPDGLTAPIYGYVTTATPGSAALPGPILIFNQGDALNITLHNIDLPSATSLMISGQPIVPDSTGVTAGNSKTYTLAAGILKPGTYLYEAGLTSDGPRQAAMGLIGALIVRPTALSLQAYSDPSTAFDDEAVLVLSEIDPAFNAAPYTTDMSYFAPKYWLINGKGFPNTAPIITDVSRKVLLRYVNAGLQHHSMSLLGNHQTIVGIDGQPSTNQSKVVAQTVPAGGTLETIVSISATAPAGTKYTLFEAAMHEDNKGASTGGIINFGGMMTFLTVGGTSVSAGGPVTSAVSLTPNPTSGPASSFPGPVTLSATIVPSTGASTTAAEFFVDTLGANGAGCPMTLGAGSASATIPNSGATAPCVDLTTLANGSHTFYVHGQDSSGTGTWGALASAALIIDKLGPAVSSMALTPNLDNGSANVQLQATASDITNGNQNVLAAEYNIDGGAATAITIAAPASVVSLNATIPAATVTTLAQGNHTVNVRAQDAFGNWGAYGSINLKVDKTGPNTSTVSVKPTPNNGTLGVQISSGGAFYVRIDAAVADPLSGGVNSSIVAAEYFFDTVGANGTGGAMIATDGVYNGASENVYGAVDLINIATLSQGSHTIYVHGKDAAGNWGPTATTTLLIDKTAPTFTGISLAPNPTNGATATILTLVGATDTGGAGVAGGEYWINPPTTTTPAPGSGTQFTGLTVSIPAGSLATGTYTVSARIRDAAGNWSTTINSNALNVVPDPIFSNGFETGTTPWGWSSASTTTTTRLNVTAGAALVGTRGLQAQGNNTNFVQFDFGTAANPATATFDARFYFNPRNNASTEQDIFAAATSNAFTTQLFHVRYRRNGTQPQIQIQVGATANAAWVNITNNVSNRIEVVWQSGVSLQLYLNGALVQTVTTASTGSVASFRLGSVTSGGSATLEYFDGLTTKRSVSPLIGTAP